MWTFWSDLLKEWENRKITIQEESCDRVKGKESLSEGIFQCHVSPWAQKWDWLATESSTFSVPMWLPGKVSWGPPTIRVAWGRKEEVGMPQHLWKQSTKPVGFHILSCGPLDVLQKQPNPQKSTSLWVWEATWVSLPNSPTHHYGTLLNRKHTWSSSKGRPFNHP